MALGTSHMTRLRLIIRGATGFRAEHQLPNWFAFYSLDGLAVPSFPAIKTGREDQPAPWYLPRSELSTQTVCPASAVYDP